MVLIALRPARPLAMSADDKKLAAALDLLKRLPPSKTYTYLEVSLTE